MQMFGSSFKREYKWAPQNESYTVDSFLIRSTAHFDYLNIVMLSSWKRKRWDCIVLAVEGLAAIIGIVYSILFAIKWQSLLWPYFWPMLKIFFGKQHWYGTQKLPRLNCYVCNQQNFILHIDASIGRSINQEKVC